MIFTLSMIWNYIGTGLEADVDYLLPTYVLVSSWVNLYFERWLWPRSWDNWFRGNWRFLWSQIISKLSRFIVACCIFFYCRAALVVFLNGTYLFGIKGKLCRLSIIYLRRTATVPSHYVFYFALQVSHLQSLLDGDLGDLSCGRHELVVNAQSRPHSRKTTPFFASSEASVIVLGHFCLLSRCYLSNSRVLSERSNCFRLSSRLELI